MRSIDVRFDTDQLIRIRPIDRFGKCIYLGGTSEPWLARLLDEFLKPGMTYFDIGAHIGQFTLIAAKRVGPTGAVHCFEAASWTYEQLADNITLNGHDNVHANHRAVFDEHTEVELHTCVPGKEAFNSIGTPLRDDRQMMGVERVQTVVIDDYVREHNIDRIDLIKIDVEGAEVRALRGASDLLSRSDSPPVIFEVNEPVLRSLGESGRSLCELMTGFGYQLYRLDTDSMRLIPDAAAHGFDDTVDLIACKGNPPLPIAD